MCTGFEDGTRKLHEYTSKRPNMRIVPIKTPEQQAWLVLHRTRRLFIRQQSAIINSICSHLAEFGIGASHARGVERLLAIADSNEAKVPEMARACIAALGVQLRQLKVQILELKRWQNTGETLLRHRRNRSVMDREGDAEI
jgi:transposase